MQTFYAIVNKSGGYEFVDSEPTFDTFVPSTAYINDVAIINVYWQGRTSAEMVNADSMVIPVHNLLMDIAIGRDERGAVQ